MEIIACSSCGKETYAGIANCPHCNNQIFDAVAAAKASVAAAKASVDAAKTSGDWSKVPINIIESYAENIVLTSSFYVANRGIEREIEFITAECVYGMNIFRDLFAGVRDIFGGRSAATQNVLRDARRTCLTELRREAIMIGADAVIAIDLDYQELSSGGKGGMLMIVASGTAVALKKEDDNSDGS